MANERTTLRLPGVTLDSGVWQRFHLYIATEHPDVVVGWTCDTPASLLLASFQQPADAAAWQFSVAMKQHTAAGVASGEGRDYAVRLPGICFRTSRLALVDLNSAFDSFAALKIQAQDFAEESDNEQWYTKLDPLVTLLGQEV